MHDDYELDFNFWPSFADLMLSLVLILITVIAAITIPAMSERVNLVEVKKSQKKLVDGLAASYGTTPKSVDGQKQEVYYISLPGSNQKDIIVRNDNFLQTITFSDNILFGPDRIDINPRGREVMRQVGEQMKSQLGTIKRIQIEGHADNIPTTNHVSNLRLGALRAIAVLEFLRDTVGITHLMSATSFGEQKPVDRKEEDVNFNNDKIAAANQTPENRSQNRRVELLLFYRGE